MTARMDLACPRCRGALHGGAQCLRCTECDAAYAIEDGIPNLLPWSGGSAEAEWGEWQEKLDRLRVWREGTWDDSRGAEARQREADRVAEAFFRFAGIPEGASVLDIGCGGASLRRFLPGRRYLGIDPMPVRTPELGSASAPLVRGVGERLPVAEAAFDAVLVCETLDHALDPARVLQEARRALHPAGLLAVLQSVQVETASPPLPVRLRVAAGRLKGRLTGTLPPDDASTKMHAFGAPALCALVQADFDVEEVQQRGQSLFLRGRAPA